MEDIENESVKTAGPNNTISLLTKVGLLMMFLFGLLMRIFVPVENFQHLANLLMSVAVLGRLFMYVRGLNPSRFFPRGDTFSTLHLIDKRETLVPSYDQRALTPLERVISDKL